MLKAMSCYYSILKIIKSKMYSIYSNHLYNINIDDVPHCEEFEDMMDQICFMEEVGYDCEECEWMSEHGSSHCEHAPIKRDANGVISSSCSKVNDSFVCYFDEGDIEWVPKQQKNYKIIRIVRFSAKRLNKV
jgi:hypothetical protein